MAEAVLWPSVLAPPAAVVSSARRQALGVALQLIKFVLVIALLYVAVGAQTKIFAENRLNAILLWLLAIVLGGTLFTPLKKLVHVPPLSARLNPSYPSVFTTSPRSSHPRRAVGTP